MKKSLDHNNLREALKYSSAMLSELKTSLLSPRNYFNLCKFLNLLILYPKSSLVMMVFDELGYLENHFIEE